MEQVFTLGDLCQTAAPQRGRTHVLGSGWLVTSRLRQAWRLLKPCAQLLSERCQHRTTGGTERATRVTRHGDQHAAGSAHGRQAYRRVVCERESICRILL